MSDSDCPYLYYRCQLGEYEFNVLKCEKFPNPLSCPEFHKLRYEKREHIANRTNQRKL